MLCLQEIKCQNHDFPVSDVESLGYNLYLHGQKTFNGVALISKSPLDDVIRGLDDNAEDIQSRYIEGLLTSESGRVIRVASIYLPNGNPVNTDKYSYKISWMERLHQRAAQHLRHEEAFILAGDYNVIPKSVDARTPEAWKGDALFLPRTRAHYHALLNLGLIDAVRACHDEGGVYTFWDYQSGAWPKDNGIRIDHLLLSPQAADRMNKVHIHREYRGLEKPSDHVPVSVELVI